MKLQIRLFAAYRDRVGKETFALEVDRGLSVGQLARRLVASFPGAFPPAESLVIAVNQEYAEPSQTLHEGDEVALIPPVSGGCP